MIISTKTKLKTRFEPFVRTRLPEVTEQDRIEDCAFQHGTYPESYIVTEPDYQYFWDDKKTGFVGYIQHGNNLHVVGGVIAPWQRKEEVLSQFCDYIEQKQLLAAFYAISEEDIPLFRSYGFQVSRFGEKTHLDLDQHHWGGRHYTWVRRQTRFVKRKGIVAKEIFLKNMGAAQRDLVFEQLHQINREHLYDRVLSHDIGLLEGKLYAEHFYRKRLFVAHEADDPDQWQGYVICTPMVGGQGWATEMYRCTKQSVRGIIPFLMVHAIDTMKNEGVEHVSLCMIPAMNCEAPLEGESPIIRFLLSLWTKRLNFLFNVQGLRYFKSRFRPQFAPAYLCVRPKATPLSTLSFLRCTGILKINWKNLVMICVRRS